MMTFRAVVHLSRRMDARVPKSSFPRTLRIRAQDGGEAIPKRPGAPVQSQVSETQLLMIFFRESEGNLNQDSGIIDLGELNSRWRHNKIQ